MDYHSLPRKQLQALCKKHEIPANQTNVQMADALAALLKVETNPKGRKQAAAEEDGRDESFILTVESNVPKVKATRSKRQETQDVEEEDCEQLVVSAEDDEGDGEDKIVNKKERCSQKLRSKSQKDVKDEVVVVEEVVKTRNRGARGEKTDKTNKKKALADDNGDEEAGDHSEEGEVIVSEATLREEENRSRQLRHLPKKAESKEQREYKVIDVAEVKEDVAEAVKPRHIGSHSEKSGKGNEPHMSVLEDVRKKVDTKKKTASEHDKAKDCGEGEQGSKDDAALQGKDNGGKQLRHLRKKAAVEQSEDKVVNIAQPEEDVEEAVRPRRKGACSEKTGKSSEPDIIVAEEVRVKRVDNKKNASEDDKDKDYSKGQKALKDEAASQVKDNGGRQLRQLRKKVASVEQFENKVVNVAQTEEDVQEEVGTRVDKKKNKKNAVEGANVHEKADDHCECEQGLKDEAASQGKDNEGRQTRHLSRKPESPNESEDKVVVQPEEDVETKDCSKGQRAVQGKDNGERQLRHLRKKAPSMEQSKNKVVNIAQNEKDVREEVGTKVDKKIIKKNASAGANVHEDHSECEQGLKEEAASVGKDNEGRQTRHLRRNSTKRTTRTNASKINQNSRSPIVTKAAVKSSDEAEEHNDNTSESSFKNETTNVQKSEKSPVVIDLVDSDDDDNQEEKEGMLEQSRVFVPSKNADNAKAGKGSGKMMPCQKTLRARQNKVSAEIHGNIPRRGHKGGEKEDVLVNSNATGKNESEATVNPSTSLKQVITRRGGKVGQKEQFVDSSSVQDKVKAISVTHETTVAEQKAEAVAVSVEPTVNQVITRRGRKGCQESHTNNSTKEPNNNATDISFENIVDASESSKQVVTRRSDKSGHRLQKVVNVNNLDKATHKGCKGEHKEENAVTVSSEEDKFDTIEEAKNNKTESMNAYESPKQVVTRRGRRGAHKEDEVVNVNNVGCRGRKGSKKEVNASAQEDNDVASVQPTVNSSEFPKQVATRRGRKGGQEELLVKTSLVEEKNNGANDSVEESVNSSIKKDMKTVVQEESSCEAHESDEDENIADSRKLRSKKDGSKSKIKTHRRQQLAKNLKSRDNANMMKSDENRQQSSSDAAGLSKKAITSRHEKGQSSSDGDGLEIVKASARKSHSKGHTDGGLEENEVKNHKKVTKYDVSEVAVEEHDSKQRQSSIEEEGVNEVMYASEKKRVMQSCQKTISSHRNTKLKGTKTPKFSTDDNIDGLVGSESKRDTDEIAFRELDAECLLDKDPKSCGDANEGLNVSSKLIGEVYSNSDKDVVEDICMSMPLEDTVGNNVNKESEERRLVDMKEDEANLVKDEEIRDDWILSTTDNGEFQTVKDENGDDTVEDRHSERELGEKIVNPDCTVDAGEISEIDDGESLIGRLTDFEGESFELAEEESNPSCEFSEDESSDSACDQEDEEWQYVQNIWNQNEEKLQSGVEQKISDFDSCLQSNDLLLDGQESQHTSCETDNDDEYSSESCEEDCDSDPSEEINHEESIELPYTGWQNDRLGLENEDGTKKFNYYGRIKDTEQEKEVTVSKASGQLDNLRVKDQNELRELENSEECAIEGCTLVSDGLQEDSVAKDEADEHNVKGSSSCEEGDFNEKHTDSHIGEEICHEKNIEISLASLQSGKYSSEDETDNGKSSYSDSSNESDVEKEFPVSHPCKQKDNLLFEGDFRETESSDNFLSEDNVIVFKEVQNVSVMKDGGHEYKPRCSTCNEEDDEHYYSDSEEFEHEEKIDASDVNKRNDGMLPQYEAGKVKLVDSDTSIGSDNEETSLAGKQTEDETRELEGGDSDVGEELYAEASQDLESEIQQDEMVETITEIRTSHVEMYDLFRNVSSDNMLCDIIPQVRDQNNKVSDLLDSNVSSFAKIHGENIEDTVNIDEQDACISAPDELTRNEENEAEQSKTCTKNTNNTVMDSVYSGESKIELAKRLKTEENAVEDSCFDLKNKFDEPESYESHDPGKVKYCEVEGDTNVVHFSGLNHSPNTQEIQEEFSSSTVVKVQLTEENPITMDGISISTEKNNEFTNYTKVLHCLTMNDSAIEQSQEIPSTDELNLSRFDSPLKMSYCTQGLDVSPCLNTLFVDEFVATSEKVELGLSESKDTNPCSDLNDTLCTEACKLEFGTLNVAEHTSDTEVLHCSGTDASALEKSEEEVLPSKFSLQTFSELDAECSGTDDSAITDNSATEEGDEVLPTEPCKLEFYKLESSGIGYSSITQRQEVVVTAPCNLELVELDSPCSDMGVADTALKMSETQNGYDMTPCLNSSYDMTQMQPDLTSNTYVSICSGMGDYAIEKSEEVAPNQFDTPSKMSDYTEGHEISPSLSTLCSLLKKLDLTSRTDVSTFSGVDDSLIEQNGEVLLTEACNLELSELSTTSGIAELTKDHDASPSLKITTDVLFFSGINDSIVEQRQEVFPAEVSNQELSPFGTTLMMTETPKSYEMSPFLEALFAEESDTIIKIAEPENVIATEFCEQEISPFKPSEVCEMPSSSNILFSEEFCSSMEIPEPANDTDSPIKQRLEVVVTEIDSPLKSPCLSTLFVEEFGTSLKMPDPTNKNDSVKESHTVFRSEQKLSQFETSLKMAELENAQEIYPCLTLNTQSTNNAHSVNKEISSCLEGLPKFDSSLEMSTLLRTPEATNNSVSLIKQSEDVVSEEVCEQERIDTQMKMAELAKEYEMSPCLNTLFAEVSSTPLKMPEPTSSIDVSSPSLGVDDSSLLEMNGILPTEACKYQTSPRSNFVFEQNSGTSMGKPELAGTNIAHMDMYDASEHSTEILATEAFKQDACEQEHSKIVTEFTKGLEMSPCLNTLFAEVSSTPSKMPEPTSPTLGADDSALLEMNEIHPTEVCSHDISQISPQSNFAFERSFGTPMGKPKLAENNNLFDCAVWYDATEASKQDTCEQERSICDNQMRMVQLTKEFEMSPCLNTLFAEVSTIGLSSPCLGVDDSCLQELNEILVTEACKRETYQISPRSNTNFEQSSVTPMEMLSIEASKQDHYELDSPMKMGQPTEGQELSVCLSIPSVQDSNSSKKTSEMDDSVREQNQEACGKDSSSIQEPSQVNISLEKPELTERSNGLQRSRETEIQFMDEPGAGKESKPASLHDRLAIVKDRLKGMQMKLEGHLQPSTYCTPARKLKGSESAKRVRETMSVSRSRLSVRSDKAAFMKENPNDFTQHSFQQQLKSLTKDKEMKSKDFEKSVTKRAALQNLSSNALEQRFDSVGKPFPSEERTFTIHEDDCS